MATVRESFESGLSDGEIDCEENLQLACDVQDILPEMTAEELLKLESVARASQDCEATVSRLLARVS